MKSLPRRNAAASARRRPWVSEMRPTRAIALDSLGVRAGDAQSPAAGFVALGQDLEPSGADLLGLVVANGPGEVPAGDRVFRASVEAPHSVAPGTACNEHREKRHRARAGAHAISDASGHRAGSYQIFGNAKRSAASKA